MLIQSALIVDDSQMARIVLKKQLEAKDIFVDMVDSGEQALEFLRSNYPDVVFMDCLMPGMDGFETTRQIKNNPETKNNTIVICTGKEADEDKQRAKDMGASDYMCKSSSPEPLQAVLNNLKNINKQSLTLDTQYLKENYIQIKALDKVLSEHLKHFDFSFLINKIAELSGKISEDVALKIAQETAEKISNEVSSTVSNEIANEVANNISLAGLSAFSKEFSTDYDKKMQNLASQFEEKIIFAVKTSLRDIHQYILQKVDDNNSEQDNDAVLADLMTELRELKFQVDRLENNNHWAQMIEQKTHETLEKNLAIYASTILEHQFAHDLIEQKVQEKLTEHNNTYKSLQTLKIKDSQAKLYSIAAIIFSASAIVLSIYSLISAHP
ncbi:response regulator [sulfur-oxidizing endosymbiont of Gigantopelta aegis]|uniref:response regulator n=1 Tax=sulfur-oxidizing endosymbiont of Gigantopelta aegis TaxID=2794934 RepID=UPI0018DDF115|nr:response regulator [sulfur-oxidizing endosymbiont of Gigantopelta aegis]